MAKGWRIRIGKLLRTFMDTRILEIRININPYDNRKKGIAVEIKSVIAIPAPNIDPNARHKDFVYPAIKSLLPWYI